MSIEETTLTSGSFPGYRSFTGPECSWSRRRYVSYLLLRASESRRSVPVRCRRGVPVLRQPLPPVQCRQSLRGMGPVSEGWWVRCPLGVMGVQFGVFMGGGVRNPESSRSTSGLQTRRSGKRNKEGEEQELRSPTRSSLPLNDLPRTP